MSQFKQLPEVAENPSTPSRISTRRSVRSQRSDSPSTAKDSSEAHPQTSTPTKSDSTRTTSPHPSEPGRKKPRKTRAPYKKKRDNASKPLGREDTDRETRHTSQRMSKEAKEAKKAERDFIIQQRLSDLEKIEESVKNHSHPEYHRLMEEIKTKYSEKKKEVEISYTLVETNYRNILSSQHKMANDQFHSERLDLRRTLIQQVQEKINSLQQEYSSLRQNLHEKGPLSHWVPPDRALVITSQTIGVSEYEANRDLEWARVREGSSLRTSANTSSTNTSASTSPEGVYSSYHYPTEAITPPQLTRPVVDPSPASRPNPLIQPLIPTEAVVSPSVGVTALAGHYQKPMENQIKARERRQQLTLPPLRPWQYNTALTL